MAKADPGPTPQATDAPLVAADPKHPVLLAALLFVLPVALLCWPLAQGRFLGGLHSDQYSAGFAFRDFGAKYFLEHGSIPQWNPYLFGGMPFVGGMHGDIFYPTAWLRLILPTGTAMGLGYAIHLVLAGLFLYLLLRALRVSWGGAVAGGLAYELTGIVASMVHPGHDGKLYAAALAPLLFLTLVRAIRDGRSSWFALTALAVGLVLLTPHPQMSYYILVAAGLWSLWLAFGASERISQARPVPALALALTAVLLGVGISALQYLPMFEYTPHMARGSTPGWEYSTGYSLPPEELVGSVIPEFNGLGPEAYWGRNFFKLHNEYLGIVVVGLAIIGAVSWRRRRVVLPLAAIALLFLMVSLGGHTPFYRLWYEVMPYMKKVRAPGMAFFLVAMPVAMFAGMGVDRLLRKEVSPRLVLGVFGGLAAFAVLAAIGVLQGIAAGLADPRMAAHAAANSGALAAGGVRALMFAAAAGGVAWALAAGRVRGSWPAIALALLVVIDLGSVERKFFVFGGPSAELFAGDPVTDYMDSLPSPVRLFDAPGQNVIGVPSVYPGSWLMGRRVQNTFGYHGNEVRYYDDVWGGKNVYANLTSGSLWNLWAVNYVVLPGPLELPGFEQALGPVTTTPGGTAYLYKRTEPQPWARVVPAAVKIPGERIIPTVTDQSFPLDNVVILSDSAAVVVPPMGQTLPAPSPLQATVSEWMPGKMTVELSGDEPRSTWLVVAETWLPGWTARVDSATVSVERGNNAQITVPLPPGARRVELEFTSPGYKLGRLISLVSLLAVLAWLAVPVLGRRKAPAEA